MSEEGHICQFIRLNKLMQIRDDEPRTRAANTSPHRAPTGFLTSAVCARVVGNGFCRGGPDESGPEQNALCSEALDGDAVIPACLWAILLEQQRWGRRKSVMASTHSQGETDWVELTAEIFYNVDPVKTCPSDIERFFRQRSLCVCKHRHRT